MRLFKSLMNSLFFLLLKLLLSTSLSGQSQVKIDSLILKLEENLSETSRYIILEELVWTMKDLDASKAHEFALEAYNIASSIDNPRYTSTILNRLGEFELDRGNIDSSLWYFNNAIGLDEKSNHTYGKARTLTNLMAAHRLKGSFYEAEEAGLQAIDLFKSIDRTSSLIRSHQRLANLYMEWNKPKKSIQQLEIKLNFKQLSKLELGRTYASLGLLNYSIENYNFALDYYHQARNLFDSLDRKAEIAGILTNIGNIYIKRNEMDGALDLNKESIRIYNTLGDMKKTAINYHNMGLIAERKGNYSEAIRFYNKSLDLKDTSSYVANKSLSQFNLANIYKKSGLNDSAIYFYRNVLEFRDTPLSAKMQSNWNLSTIFMEKGLLDSAQFYQKQYGILRDSTDRILSEAIQAKDDFERTMAAKELLVKENQVKEISINKKNQMILGLSIILFLILLISLFYFRNNQLKQRSILAEKNAEIRQQQVNDLLKDHELKEMGAMLERQEKERKRIAQDLHDRLGSMLSMVKIHFKSVEDGIQALQSQNHQQSERANSLLDKACDEVRKIAHDMASGVLSKFGLIAALHSLKKSVNSTNQLTLNILDFGFEKERLNYEVEINLYRIIQELLSNVLKHADANEMTIQLFKKEKNLNILVEDNGIGFDPNNQSGMGLKNVLSRVEKLNGELTFDTGKGSGTTITIDIAINKNDKSTIS